MKLAHGNIATCIPKLTRLIVIPCDLRYGKYGVLHFGGNRARQLYKNISMLFLFPVKDSKLSTGDIAIFNASCYG